GAGASAYARYRASDLGGAGRVRAQRVGEGETQVVVAVHRDRRLVDVRHPVPDHADQVGELLGIGVADRVRDVDRGGAGFDRALDAAAQGVVLGARAVLARRFDVVAVVARPGDAVDHRLVHLLRGHLQLDPHVQGAGRDVGVDALARGRLQRL